MIIGKNTNFQANNNQFIKENKANQIVSNLNPMIEQTRTMQHTDVTSRNEMNEKAFSMLQDRLNKGLISLEEFNKKCNELGKRR